MRKTQRTFTIKRQSEESVNYGMPFESHIEVEKHSFNQWLNGNDYALKRSELQEMINHVYKQLSTREKEVFNYLKMGHKEQEIAHTLGISRAMVQTYRGRIRKKFAKHDNITP